jgi:cytochrome c peroxidase
VLALVEHDAAVDAERAARGRAHFESAAVGCAGCHAGERGTDNKSYDVGTGITLQTPPLRGLATRTRFMHDGCAGELTDRFDPACGGDSHGNIDALDANELGDLVEYLRSR